MDEADAPIEASLTPSAPSSRNGIEKKGGRPALVQNLHQSQTAAFN
jgi:hypothetical protein